MPIATLFVFGADPSLVTHQKRAYLSCRSKLSLHTDRPDGN